MSDQHALDNNHRISEILARAASGEALIKVPPKPQSQFKFQVFIAGVIDQFSGGQIRLIQQALFNEFGCHTTVIRAQQMQDSYMIELVPDIDIEGNIQDIKGAINCIVDETEIVNAINFYKGQLSYMYAPRRSVS